MTADATTTERPRYAALGSLIAAYIALYLARKNLSVAIPLLREAFSASTERLGALASAGSLAYAIGKVVSGPVVDRIGGRAGVLLSLLAVALFAAASGAVPSLAWIAAAYALNRGFGAAAWGAMLKLLPTWFSGRRLVTAIAALSLSYVAGGAAAALFAREVIVLGGGYRAVLAAPAVPIVLVALVASRTLAPGPLTVKAAVAPPPPDVGAYLAMLRSPNFLLACALSFLVTLLREAFGTWSVDFLAQINGGTAAIEVAAVQSIGFDLAGAVGIVAMAATYGALGPRRGTWLIVASLVAVAPAILLLSHFGSKPLVAAALLSLIGFLLYGPFSLLGGLLSLGAGGARLAASASGLIDGVGYVASALAGVGLGRVIATGGYSTGFGVLAVLALLAGALATRLRLSASFEI